MAMEMEEGLTSTVSNAGTTTRRRKRKDQAVAYASSFTGFLVQDSKHLSHGSSNSLSANTKVKGVVLQKNGNHNRVWLGRFDSEVKPAMSYDSAAIKLHNREFVRTNTTVQERHFQNLFSKEAILNMIKEGSYQARFVAFLMACQAAEGMQKVMAESNSVRLQQSIRDILPKQLFQKELTPSDVGKLNRLVIPKNYATRYFPRIDDNPARDVQLSFYDENLKEPWKFRYCYWKSSHSYVFTRSWNRFVKNRKHNLADVSCNAEQASYKVKT